jgi:hypothetical protein
MPKIFWIAQFVAIVLVLTYIIYLVLHLRKPQDKASTATDLNFTHRKDEFETPQKSHNEKGQNETIHNQSITKLNTAMKH